MSLLFEGEARLHGCTGLSASPQAKGSKSTSFLMQGRNIVDLVPLACEDGLSETSLLANTIRIKIPCAGSILGQDAAQCYDFSPMKMSTVFCHFSHIYKVNVFTILSCTNHLY